MIANEQKVQTGGLMRCCLSTLGNYEEDVEVGATLDCKYEEPGNVRMILDEDDDGPFWRWNRPGW